MKILALDLGKSKSVACMLDTRSHRHRFEKVKTAPFPIQDLLERERPDRVVFEIGPQAGWVHDLVCVKGIAEQVANPNHEAWRWRNVKRKTDRLDALKLARLSAMDQVPTVYMPAPAVRQRRSLIAYRRTLVDRRTAIKNHIRSILTRQGLPMPSGKSGWTVASLGRLWKLAEAPGDVGPADLWRAELHLELSMLSSTQKVLGNVESTLNQRGRRDARVQLLRTIPGVGPRLAEAFVAAVDDPNRFRTGRQVGSYFGLVPRQYQSGTCDRQGRISGQGNALVRNLLVEVAWLGIRTNDWMRTIYERVLRGSPSRKKIAIVAVARRLAVLCWAMLRDGTPWREAAACAAVA